MKEHIAHCKQTKLAHYKKSNPNHQLVYLLALGLPYQAQLSKLLVQTVKSKQKIHIVLLQQLRLLTILIQAQRVAPMRQKHPRRGRLGQISKRTLQSTFEHLQVAEKVRFLLILG